MLCLSPLSQTAPRWSDVFFSFSFQPVSISNSARAVKALQDIPERVPHSCMSLSRRKKAAGLYPHLPRAACPEGLSSLSSLGRASLASANDAVLARQHDHTKEEPLVIKRGPAQVIFSLASIPSSLIFSNPSPSPSRPSCSLCGASS